MHQSQVSDSTLSHLDASQLLLSEGIKFIKHYLGQRKLITLYSHPDFWTNGMGGWILFFIFHSWAIQCRGKSLRKHAYSNILKILPAKNKKNQIKNSGIFNIAAKNIDCEYSLELPR